MKAFWAVLAVLLALAGWARRPESLQPKPASTTAVRPAASRMNVLLITIDTLRADHLGTYGYRRKTSPRIDALAAEGAVFEQAYTYWPKTRGSFVMMMTGLRPSQNGYSKKHEMLLGRNPTLAGALQAAGYETVAIVDNPNVAAQHGYNKGFDRYRETWLEIRDPAQEMARTKIITEDGVRYLSSPPADKPFFLWLHYVNPHAPYTPPAPYDTLFMDAEAAHGAPLRPVKGYRGGVREEWEIAGKGLRYYVAQYDGEIAAVDQEVGQVLDALARGGAAANTMIVLSSDHGESLGEHDYFFDHGEDLHDPSLRIPLVVRVPGAPRAVRSRDLATTLDFLPTILNATKVALPPNLSGRSLLAQVAGQDSGAVSRLFAQNAHHHNACFDARFKAIAVPDERTEWRFSLYDREADPGETRDAAVAHPQALRVCRRALELSFERAAAEWAVTRRDIVGEPPPKPIDCETCRQLAALGYVDQPGCDNC